MGRGILWFDIIMIFVKVFIPIIGILSLFLFLKPNFYVELEKKLSHEIGPKVLRRKTIKALEKENLALHNKLLRNNRAVGLLCFVFSLILILILFKK